MPICKALDNQVHVTIDGYYKPCCAFAFENTQYPITEYTPQEYLASDYIQNIINEMTIQEKVNLLTKLLAKMDSSKDLIDLASRKKKLVPMPPLGSNKIVLKRLD